MKNKAILAWLKKQRVAVLKGGWSTERSISLKTGTAVENSFRRLKIPFSSLDIKPTFLSTLKHKNINFCFLALHGPFGEDGQIQTALDAMGISYTGSGPRASALAMDKDLSKLIFKQKHLPVAPWCVLSKSSQHQKGALSAATSLFRRGSVFVKPVDQGSALGANRVEKKVHLNQALKACFRVSERAMVETFIQGREVTVSILGSRILPVIEIVPQHSFYDFHSKYASGGSQHILPAPLTSRVTRLVQTVAFRAFQSLGCEVYGRVDVMLTNKDRPVLLEVNTIPGMTDTSLLPEAARAIGLTFDDLVLEIIRLSRLKKK